MKGWWLLLFLICGCSETPDQKAQSGGDLLASFNEVLQSPGVYSQGEVKGSQNQKLKVAVSRAVPLSRLEMRLDTAAKGLGAEKAALKRAAGAKPALQYKLGDQTVWMEFSQRPAIAVVLDDWGHQKEPLEMMAVLPGPMNMAVIPHQTYSRLAAQTAKRYGHEVLVHLPMQSVAGEFQEKSTLRVGMPAQEVNQLVQKALASLPEASGVNNHQGSLATADAALMKQLLLELASANKYFLDSRTTANSKGREAAKAAGIAFARRHVFLDNEQSPGAVAAQWQKTVARAKKQGVCIAIGHYYPVTLSFLKDNVLALNKQGIDLVRVSDLAVKE